MPIVVGGGRDRPATNIAATCRRWPNFSPRDLNDTFLLSLLPSPASEIMIHSLNRSFNLILY
jgi:hypothetical protein